MKKTDIYLYETFSRNINKLANDNDGRYCFADMIGVAYDSVRRWCNGQGLPNGKQLLSIRETYNVSIDWLLTGTSITPIPADKSSVNLAKQEGGTDLLQDWPPEIQAACRTVKKILLSDDKATAEALKQNIHAFAESINRRETIQELEECKRISTMEKVTGAG